MRSTGRTVHPSKSNLSILYARQLILSCEVLMNAGGQLLQQGKHCRKDRAIGINDVILERRVVLLKPTQAYAPLKLGKTLPYFQMPTTPRGSSRIAVGRRLVTSARFLVSNGNYQFHQISYYCTSDAKRCALPAQSPHPGRTRRRCGRVAGTSAALLHRPIQ